MKRGDHRIWLHPAIEEGGMLNFQESSGGKAKAYQVRQLVSLIEEHGLINMALPDPDREDTP